MRVAAVGDNCLDVYVEQDLLTVGGNALNVAANWLRLGLSSRYFGAVGEDEAGTAIRDGVNGVGLDAADMVTLPGTTGVTLIRLVNNDREFLHEEFGVGLEWHPTDAVIETVQAFDWVHTAGIPPEARFAERLAAEKVRFSVDLSTYHDFDRLDGVELAFASSDTELDASAHDLAAAMVDAGAQHAVVMCGEHGSLVRSGTETTTTRAQKIRPIDTCGAGDSFIAGYIKSHLQGTEPQICLVQATANATRTCLHVGGFEQEPRLVPQWLKDTYYELAATSSA